MKTVKTALTIISISVVFLLGRELAQAQFRTDSNTVTTKVGNPSSGGSIASCPIPNGIITCGSKNVPINGCGHCGLGYEAYMANCTYPGIYYAMDIAGADFTNVILPSVSGKIIQWTFSGQTNNIGNQAIQLYSGTDSSTGEKFWIQFHHTQPGSGLSGTRSSGEIGAKICGDGCGMGHVHVEFAKIDPSGGTVWQDAPDYFCR